MSILAAVVAVTLSVVSALPAPQDPLKKADAQAKELVRAARSQKAYKDLERLRKDLRYISEELDREVLGPRRTLEEYSQGGLARLSQLRIKGNIDPKLQAALDRLEGLYRDLPTRVYARNYPRGTVKALGHELRWIADEAKTEAELLKLIEENLVFPEVETGGDGYVEAEALFPQNLSLQKFKRLGPIRIFLMKHRISRPKVNAGATTAEQIVAGRHNVQIGVEIEGAVVDAGLFWGDQDYTFDIGNLHIELTPEWRLLHPNTPKPKVGDRIRVKGWTYFDVFHTAEEEYDPEHPRMGISRVTLWEVHPVQEIEILP